MKIKLIIIVLLFIIQAKAQCYRFVNAGNYQTLALKSDNTLWGFGANYNGELGDGTYNVRNTISQIGVGSNWLMISTGAEHTIAIKTDGTLWAWGSNTSGQLGDGTTIKKNIPIQIGTDNNWQSVSTKGWTSFGIKNNGTLWGWGQNTVSNIGLGYYSLNITVPTQVGIENNWKNIYAGHDHNIAIKTDNTLWCWGSNAFGQVGTGVFLGNYLTPTQVGTNTDWKTASTGLYHTLAIKNNGTLWAWGSNENGALGDGTTTNKNLPIQIGTSTDWNILSATYNSSYGIKNDGSAWAWGNNSNYELGNGSTTNSYLPIQIGNESNWKSISCRASHEIALKTDNSIFYWGNNNNAIPNQSNIPLQLTNSCVLSINNYSHNSELLYLYPNHAKQIVRIFNGSESTIQSVIFIDMTGKKILDVNKNFDEINIEKLQNGIYIVSVNLGIDGYSNIKFIKE